MKLKGNLAELRKLKGYTQDDLAKKLGKMVGRPPFDRSLISRMEKNPAMISLEYLAPLAKLLDTEIIYDSEEEAIAYQPGKPQLNATGIAKLYYIGDLLRLDSENIVQPEPLYLPYFMQGASAGTGQYLDDNSTDSLPVSSYLHNMASFAVPVVGDSMEPYAFNGWTAFVQSVQDGGEVRPGDVGLFSVMGEGYIKQLHLTEDGQYLHSLNAGYSDIPLFEQDYTVFGKVVAVLADKEKAVTYVP